MFQEPQPQLPQPPQQNPAALFDVVPNEMPLVGDGKKEAYSLIDANERLQEASLQAALRSFQKTTKDSMELVAFRRSQRLAGLPEPTDAQQMLQYADIQRVNLANMQTESPVLFERLKDYENAELLRQDTAAWSMAERITGTTKRGEIETYRNELAFKRNYSSLSAEEEEQFQQYEKQLELLPQANGNWVAAAGKMVGQMYAMGPKTAAGAAIGATVGAIFGGGVGAAPGAYWGATLSGAGQTFVTEAGAATQEMIDQGYDPEAARTTGVLHGAVAASLSALSFGTQTAQLRSVIRGAVSPAVLSKLGIDPAKKMLFGNITAKASWGRYGAAALGEVGEEVGQELSQILAERIAGSISKEEYQLAIQTAQGTQSIGERIAAIATETFQGMALLGLPGLALDLSTNKSRMDRAESRAKALTETLDILRGTSTAKLAPDVFADHVAEVAEKDGMEELVISRKDLESALTEVEDNLRKQNAGIAVGDAMRAFRAKFPELSKQMDAAEKSGADIRIGIGDVALMARGEFGLHEHLLKRGRIVGEGMDGDTGISWEEAQKQRHVAEQLRSKAMSITARRGQKVQSEYDQVRKDVERKLQVVPQYTRTQRRFLAQVVADYHTVRSERLSQGGSPMSVIESYQQENARVTANGVTAEPAKFAEKPAPVQATPEATVTAQPTPEAQPAEGAKAEQPATEAPKEEAAAPEAAQPLVAPESLKFQDLSKQQRISKQLFDQETAASKTPLSTAAAKRFEGIDVRQEELAKLEGDLKSEADRVRKLDKKAYLAELEQDLDKAEELLKGMDPNSDDFKDLFAWAKYTHAYLLQEAQTQQQEAEVAEEQQPQAEAPVEEQAPPQGDVGIPTTEEIVEAVQVIAEAEQAQAQAELAQQETSENIAIPFDSPEPLGNVPGMKTEQVSEATKLQDQRSALRDRLKQILRGKPNVELPIKGKNASEVVYAVVSMLSDRWDEDSVDQSFGITEQEAKEASKALEQSLSDGSMTVSAEHIEAIMVAAISEADYIDLDAVYENAEMEGTRSQALAEKNHARNLQKKLSELGEFIKDALQEQGDEVKALLSAIESENTVDIAYKPDIKPEQVAKAKEVVKAVEGNKQISELAQAARNLAAGKITRAEWDATVNRLQPIKKFEKVPEIANIHRVLEVRKLLGKGDEGKVKQSNGFVNGTRIAIRLDIPSFEKHKTWVVTVHEATKSNSGNPRAVIGYTNAIAVENATFASREERVFKIAQEIDNKAVSAVINGDKADLNEAKISKMAQEAMSDPSWVQVGFNPKVHSYFWDRATGNPVVAADLVLQVGPLTLAKNAKFGKREDFLYSRAGGQPVLSEVEAEQAFSKKQDVESPGLRKLLETGKNNTIYDVLKLIASERDPAFGGSRYADLAQELINNVGIRELLLQKVIVTEIIANRNYDGSSTVLNAAGAYFRKQQYEIATLGRDERYADYGSVEILKKYAGNKSVVIHEIIHALTLHSDLKIFADYKTSPLESYALFKEQLNPSPGQQGIVSDLGPLRDLAEAYVAAFEAIDPDYISGKSSKIKFYGFTTLPEFVAEAFANSSFQNALASIVVEPKVTAWDKFVSAVRKVLGLSRTQETVLDVVIRAGAQLMTETPTTPRKYKNLLKSYEDTTKSLVNKNKSYLKALKNQDWAKAKSIAFKFAKDLGIGYVNAENIGVPVFVKPESGSFPTDAEGNFRSLLDIAKDHLPKPPERMEIYQQGSPDVMRSRAGGQQANDAAYLDAVTRGDMETAQRMVDAAAKEAGYTIGPVFHGTPEYGFNVFQTFDTTFGLMGTGSYFTDSKEVASGYASKKTRKNQAASESPQSGIYSVYLNIKNPIDMDAPADPRWGDIISEYVSDASFKTNEDALKELQDGMQQSGVYYSDAGTIVRDAIESMGYDGIRHIGGGRVSKDGAKHNVFIAYNPEQIKSSEAVTKDKSGNVIPLSQRFQPASPDIRYSRAQEAEVAGYVNLSTNEITLTKEATFATFLHEMSHIWLETLMADAQSQNAPKQIVDDATAVLNWFGLKSFDEWRALSKEDRTERHERWAYNFEGYISGEEAPSRELTSIFRAFRRWLTAAWTNIRTKLNLAYREELQALGKAPQDLPILTTEVAEVMNRLLATDEQIAMNQDFQSLMALHMTKEQWLNMGNTEAEWLELLRLQTHMAGELTDDLTEKTISAMHWLSSRNVRMLREHKAKIDKQREEIAKQFLPDLQKKRVHMARTLVSTGTLGKGSTLVMDEARLNLGLVRKLFEDDAATLARIENELGTGKTGLLYSKGVDPAQIALVTGYTDAKQMIREMLNAPSLEQELSDLVDAEMKQKYKHLLDAKKVQKEISAQLSGKIRQKMVAIELRGLDRNLRSESDAAQPNLVGEMQQAQKDLEKLLTDDKALRDERNALRKRETEIKKQITKEKRSRTRSADRLAALNAELQSVTDANKARITEINGKLKESGKLIRKTERLAEGPRTTIATILRAAQEVAAELIGKTLVKDALPSYFESNARMRRRGTTTALARGDSLGAIEQKRGELTQAAMADEATSFQQEMDRFQEFVREMFRMSKADIAKNRDYNMAVAARGIAAAFGFGTEKQAQDVVDAVKAMRVYAPEIADQVEQMLSLANQQATKISKDATTRGAAGGRSKRNRVGLIYRELTVEQMQQLMDRVTGLWKTSAEERQVELGGTKRTVDEAAGLLAAKVMDRMKSPVKAGKAASGIMSYVALATRAEHLMEHLDGQTVGEWQLMVYRWVKEHAVKARGEFTQKLFQLSDILKDIDMRQGQTVVATELGGHVFGSENPLISELIHVIAHMGNPENLEKMVMGMARVDNPKEFWGKYDEEGNLDTSDLTKFIERMIEEKVLTVQHFQAVEKIFDLMDTLTPGAVKAFYKVNRYNMKLVKHGTITNSLGTFRGGYVPSVVDKDAAPIGGIMDIKAQMNGDFTERMHKARDGFTKERVKKGGLPRVININSLSFHMRDVLMYTHLQPVMNDLAKVMSNEQLQNALRAYDPAIIRNVISPWIGRTVYQLTQTPTSNPLDKIARKIRRNVGLDKLALSLNVMFQQFTGLSVSATRVGKQQLAKALVIWRSDPKKARDMIVGLSPAMQERFDNQMTEMQNKLDEIMTSPDAYKNMRKWIMENGLFLQAGAQNIVDTITWIGAFNQAMETKGRGLPIEEAQKIAASDADSIVRLTQGGGFAEDLSTAEAGTVWSQLFTQFQTVFIVMMNATGWKARTLIQDMGMAKASPRVMALAFFGLFLPYAIGNLISETMRGELGDDEDMDGVSETWFRTLVAAPLSGIASGLPQIGILVNFGLNSLDNKRYNDKLGSTPVFSAFEAARRGLGGAYELITDPSRTLRGQDIKDWATLIATITGIPVSTVARPLSYALDESRGYYRADNLTEYARGLTTGTAIPTNR